MTLDHWNIRYLQLQCNMRQRRELELDPSNHLKKEKRCSDTDGDLKPSIPFWLGNEEPSHIRLIMSLYSKYLHLDTFSEKQQSVQNNMCVIRPRKFIGKLVRYPSFPLSDEDCSKCLCTLDKVYVYRRERFRVQGKLMPFSKIFYLQTIWSLEDGIPLRHVTIEKKKYFESRIDSQSRSFILLTLPIFDGEEDEYKYFSLEGDKQYCDICTDYITYADLVSLAIQKNGKYFDKSKGNYNWKDKFEDDDMCFCNDDAQAEAEMYDDDFNNEEECYETFDYERNIEDNSDESSGGPYDEYFQSLLSPSSSPFACLYAFVDDECNLIVNNNGKDSSDFESDNCDDEISAVPATSSPENGSRLYMRT